MLQTILHLIGTAMLEVMLAFILVDFIHSKKETKMSVIGRLLLVAFLLIAMLRT